MKPALTITFMAAALAGGALPSFPQDFLAEPGAVESIAAPSFTPPGCSVAPFSDVSTGDLYCPWIQQLAVDGITVGCGGGKYCPHDPVTRAQLSMLLEKAMRGTDKWTHAASFFGRFGGNGQDGERIVNGGTEYVGAVRRQYSQLTVPFGQTLLVDNGFAYIAVQARCTIAGTIDAAGLGTDVGIPLTDGWDGVGNHSGDKVRGCLGGAGGGGGTVIDTSPGRRGGGASNDGGFGLFPGGPPEPALRPFSEFGGATGMGAGDTVPNDFGQLLDCTGGSGGGGGPSASGSIDGANGGRGGGVVYLECGELDFSGVLDVSGTAGFTSDVGSGSGGGGGGGVVLVRTRKIVANTGVVRVPAGVGGGGRYPAGDGAPGYWDIVVVP